MKLILETLSAKYFLTTSREYYHNHTVDNEELIVLQNRLMDLPDWIYTLPCAERVGIVQYDTEGNRIVVGNNHTTNPFTLTRVTNRF